MSKNFDLLQRASQGEFERGGLALPATMTRTYEMRPVPSAHVLSREELVKLVQAVFLAPGKESRRAVVFAGAAAECGCTSICLGASQALAAECDQSVCLVDSNLRFPSMHLCLGAENRRGLSEAISESGPIQDYVRKLPIPNLWFLPSGVKCSPLAGTGGFGGRLSARLAELRQAFRYVLMDCPPVNVYSDALALAQWSDGVVLIVSANATRREAARRAKEYFVNAGADVIGVVLNNRTYPIPQVIYDRL
jgi:Mrp family chromosome partitioning ATPase